MIFNLYRVYENDDPHLVDVVEEFKLVESFERENLDSGFYWAKVYAMAETTQGVDYDCDIYEGYELRIEHDGKETPYKRFAVELTISVVGERDAQ